MPDLQEFGAAPRGSANVNVPTYGIFGKLTDSSTGAVLSDFTGDNEIKFPAVLSTITTEQYQEIIDLVAQRIIQIRGGE